MSLIELRDDAAFAAQDAGVLGYVPNYNRLYARRPAVYAAWKQLNGAVKESMDLRRYELATVAAARRLKSEYCTLAHEKVLRERFGLGDDETDLDDAERAIVRFAAKVADDATSVTSGDVDELRALGLSEDDVFDIVLAVAARCFFSTTLSALGVEPDAQLRPS
jgi:alkylhydroperoxidase family enzyme